MAHWLMPPGSLRTSAQAGVYSTMMQQTMRRSRKYNPETENIEIDLLLSGIYRQYGINLQDYSPAPLRRRIWEAIKRENTRTVSGLQEKLFHDFECFDRFVESLNPLVAPYGPEFYQKFRRDIVPLLRTYPFIRIWQVGCSSVPEAYSFAILLLEEGLYDKSVIYATDTNEYHLKKAEDGIFPLAEFERLEENYSLAGGKGRLENYFSGGGKSGVFSQILKRNMVFGQHNLATDSSFNEFNAILCRTALSCFNREFLDRAHDVLYNSLALFGILGLAPQEKLETISRESCYAPLDLEHNLYRKIC
ncbi:MAG: CheR family methyltransferase [Verrucomicrobiales bacterium]